MKNLRFTAPWGTLLKVITGLSIAFILGIPVVDKMAGFPDTLFYNIVMMVLPPIGLFVSVFFCIRGYVLTPRVLLIQRLGWHSTISLDGLQAAEIDPKVMDHAVRNSGNGGLFCFAGSFYNQKLGRFRVFATDPARSVVLKFSDHTVVVTPGDPQAFAEVIHKYAAP